MLPAAVTIRNPRGNAARLLAERTRVHVDAILDSPLLGTILRTALLVAGALVIELLLMRITHLPQSAYQRPFLTRAVLERLAGAGIAGWCALGLLASLIVVAARSRSLGPAWTDFEHSVPLRWLIVSQTAVLAWMYASYDYNFYFDRSHVFDRLLLVASVPLLAWRPVFVALFLAVLLPIIWQFTYPIGGFSWAVPILPVRVVILVAALWCLRLATNRVRTMDFVFVLCATIAANYWASGVGKLQLGWAASDRIGFMLAATYANGWLAFAGADTIAAMVRGLLAWNGPAKLVTLLVECGAILMLWRLATARGLLAGAILLHVAVFIVSGIGFWQWSLLNAVVIVLFFGRASPSKELFTRSRFVLSIILIGGGALWFRPVRLAWLDARATYTYRLEATDESGAVYVLAPAFFAPYDYPFTLSGFRYLVDAPRLPVAWGATIPVVARALNGARTPQEVLAVELELGRNHYDPDRSRDFEAFVQRFVTTWEHREGRGRWATLIKAPATLWTFPRSDPALNGRHIVRVTVYEVLSFFDDERYAEIRRVPVRIIPIESPAPG